MAMYKMPATAKGGNGNGCSHHWLIEAARGTQSNAVCKYCGEKRVFFNEVSALEYFSIKGASCRKGGKVTRKKNRGEPIPYDPVTAAMELKGIRG